MAIALPLAAFAPMWLLPSPSTPDSPKTALAAYAREVRTGEMSVQANLAHENGFDVTYQDMAWYALAHDGECWGQRLDDLSLDPQLLPEWVCESRD